MPHDTSSDSPDAIRKRLADALAPDFQVVRRLGEGSTASVFLCREPELRRMVAVKVLSPDVAEDETARRRFEREARTAASISHPGIVEIYRVDRLEGDLPYLIMQYVKGRSLSHLLAARPPERDEMLRILADLASALAEAHQEGVVHRDVRPENVLYHEETGRVYLTDFGIAAIQPSGDEYVTRLTRTGEHLGDPVYASPEQLAGDSVTEHADIYSLAVLAYQSLAGRGPYDAETPQEWIVSHLRSEPRPLRDFVEVDPELDDLLSRCLAKEPERRPNAEDLEARLRTLAARGGKEDVPGSPLTPELGTSEPPAPRGSAAPEPSRSAMRRNASEMDAGRADRREPAGVVGELRARRVPQIVGAFLAFGLAVMGPLDQMEGQEMIPGLAYELWIAFFAAGLPASAVVAWYHGEKGPQKIHATEIWLLAALALGWLVASALIIAG